ncbi:MAG TPA: peptidoglycan DD-metalloendopeptidase family protein [Thermodesulfobacteriota bacterium]|nr:peptidoglycan DD-metalloendopeptidase family protein [Thermodesulfobacteriota bacterium]
MKGLLSARRMGIGCLLIGGLLLLGTPDAWAAQADQMDKDLTQKKKDLKDIKKEINLAKKKEKEVQGKESSILENLHLLEAELYRKEKELKQMETPLSQTRERLRQTKQQIGLLGMGMERTKEELFSRLVALYKMGRVPTGGLLLTSQSYPDLLRLDKYLRVILDRDSRLVATYRYQVALNERYQEELIQDQLQWQRSISEIEKKKREITKVSGERRVLLKSIQDQKVVYQKVILELEERAKDLQTFVDKLEREKSLLAYGKPRYEPLKGKLTPPVQGKVISSFKEKGQNGVEIRAAMGAEIRAVLSGKVLYADWFKGFGNIVIIDHGDHTFTVSGYCSELLKKSGDAVSQGEVIALVGSSGSLKGPCLYFEIRHHGKPQDPMEWLVHSERVVSLPEEDKKGKKGY